MPMRLNSMIGQLATKRAPDLPADLRDFEMIVLAPERTFIEKLYAIDDAFRRGFITQRTRHFYDVHKLFKTTKIRQFLKTGDLLNLFERVRDKTQQYYSQQATPSMADLVASKAFDLTGEYYAKVEQGYKNDSVLYYQETIPFVEIAESINTLRIILRGK